MTSPTPPALNQLKFSPKIDYVTIEGTSRVDLPILSGLPKWPRNFHGTRLTIHDPSGTDIRLIEALFPGARLTEIEVAVDIYLAERTSAADVAESLALVKSEYVAKGLKPVFPDGLNGGFRGCYRKTVDGYRLWPYSRRVPSAEEQHLHGRRDDGAQVKVYLKTMDQGKPLAWRRHSVRIEVRLGVKGLESHHLFALGDLMGFRFRKELLPYFQHVRSSSRKTTKATRTAKPLLALLISKQEMEDAEQWHKVGVGTFEPGGRRADAAHKVRFHRSQDMNCRIGQALHRLQGAFSPKKFVCLVPPGKA